LHATELIITLVGMPGSGKSTVGRHLARRLGLPFTDSDEVIEQRIGCTIREFFEREGEPRFRAIEHQVLEDLTRDGTRVLATGGGSVLREDNRAVLKRTGTVVYLRTAPEDLFRRLRQDLQRPLLQVADPLAKLRELYEQRDPLYREVADFVIETGRPSVLRLVNMLLMQLELAGKVPGRQGPAA
jgi:shikimate kinase